MDEFGSEPILRVVKHGALAEIGRMLTWLGENCEAYSLQIPTPQRLAEAGEPMSIRVDFRDPFEARAFRSRFLPGVEHSLMQ